MDVLFSDSEYFQTFVYVAGATVLVVVLFVISKIAKVGVGARVKSSQLPFGMTTKDLEKFAASNNLTPEELKKIRAAMGRQFLERTKEQEHLASLPPDAEDALREAELEMPQRPPTKPAVEPVVALPLAELPPPADPENDLPAHLQSLSERSEFELTEMRDAGFMTPEDYDILMQRKLES